MLIQVAFFAQRTEPQEMELLADLIQYLRRPFFTQHRDPLTKNNVLRIAKLLVVKIAIAIALSVLVHLAFHILGQDTPESHWEDEPLFDVQLLFAIVFWAPILEELLFRSWMGRKWTLLLGFPVFVSFLMLLFEASDLAQIPALTSLLYMIFALFYVALLIGIRKIPNAHNILAQTLFPFVFWTSTISFSLIHLGNFGPSDIGLASVFFVIPQFIAGLVYGYIRMRFGFLAGVFSHMAWNAIVTAITLVIFALEVALT